MKDKETHLDSVREYFDRDSKRYENARYTSEYSDCHQYSYLNRMKIVLELLEEGGGMALDIGCGPGIYTRELLDRGFRILGIDISPGMIEIASDKFGSEVERGAVRFEAGDISDLAIEKESFDMAICIGVISYIEDLPRFLTDLGSYLKPDGYAIFQISKSVSPKSINEKLCLPALSGLKRAISRNEQNEGWDFRLRRYRVGKFNRLCGKHGFLLERGSHFDYTFPLLSTILPRLNLMIAAGLEKRTILPFQSLLAGDFVGKYRYSPVAAEE